MSKELTIFPSEQEQNIRTSIDALKEEAQEFRVTTRPQYDEAIERMKKIKAYMKRLDEVEIENKAPYQDVLSKVKEFEKLMSFFTKVLKDLDSAYRKQANDFLAREHEEAQRKQAEERRKAEEEERKRQEELRKQAEKEAKKTGGDAEKILEQKQAAAPEAMVAPMEKPNFDTKSELGTSHTRMKWEVEAVDLSKIPLEYMMFNQSKALADVKLGKREIPGCIIREVPIASVRT